MNRQDIKKVCTNETHHLVYGYSGFCQISYARPINGAEWSWRDEDGNNGIIKNIDEIDFLEQLILSGPFGSGFWDNQFLPKKLPENDKGRAESESDNDQIEHHPLSSNC